MLECGHNYKGSMNEKCRRCNTIDDENHRLNHCILYRTTNFYDSREKVNFQNVYSDDINVLRSIIPKLGKVWNTRSAHGNMVS